MSISLLFMYAVYMYTLCAVLVYGWYTHTHTHTTTTTSIARDAQQQDDPHHHPIPTNCVWHLEHHGDDVFTVWQRQVDNPHLAPRYEWVGTCVCGGGIWVCEHVRVGMRVWECVWMWEYVGEYVGGNVGGWVGHT